MVGDLPTTHSIPHPGRQLISLHVFLEWSTTTPAATSLSVSGKRPSLRGRAKRTAWPRLKGWISRKANTRADSYSLKQGMSPASWLARRPACSGDQTWSGVTSPFMILQKIQDATEAMVRERETWVNGCNRFVGGGSAEILLSVSVVSWQWYLFGGDRWVHWKFTAKNRKLI